ncbi:MAG: ABC transporter ATP-binding protein [Candidatus Xenobia bacterium]
MLTLEAVQKQYASGLRAVDGVSFSVEKGETFALVGESGCGKSTLARLILGLMPLSAGRIRFDGIELSSLQERQRLPYRRRMAMVFQDPGASLNPRDTVETSLLEPVRIHRAGPVDVDALLKQVGLGPEHRRRHPHELSGGQKQRIAIARALVLEPDMIVLDEPTSALDVSVQAQILNLLTDLQARLGLTYLFITHNLAVVRHLATRCAVMYRGRIVELGEAHAVLDTPLHPYTKLLVSSIPGAHHEAPLEVPSGRQVPPGACIFAARCPSLMPRCTTEDPALRTHRDRAAACHLVEPTDP